MFSFRTPAARLLIGRDREELLGIDVVDVVAVLRIDVAARIATRILRAHPEMLDRLPRQLQSRRPAHELTSVVRHLLRPVVEMRLRHLLARLARLVRAEMDDRHLRSGCERAEFVDELAEDDPGLLVRERGESRRLAEREGVARHVEFGDHGDAALLRMVEHPAELGLRVVLADVAREGPALLQLGMLLRLQPPAVVVRKVPVEDVHLVPGEMIEEIEDRFDGLVVAAAVEQ